MDKERDSAFCRPKIAYGNCVVHGSRPDLPDKVMLLLEKFPLAGSLMLRQKLWVFFLGQWSTSQR